MKPFPANIPCDDSFIREASGSAKLLGSLWNKFPALRDEFVGDFEVFKVYAKSVAEGRSRIVRGCVSTSKRPSQPVNQLVE
ncbi:MAG: hypothetical protein KC643_15815 [Nitrospira sp.]|nr:hypothetical protein [Nitrospira sp.]